MFEMQVTHIVCVCVCVCGGGGDLLKITGYIKRG